MTCFFFCQTRFVSKQFQEKVGSHFIQYPDIRVQLECLCPLTCQGTIQVALSVYWWLVNVLYSMSHVVRDLTWMECCTIINPFKSHLKFSTIQVHVLWLGKMRKVCLNFWRLSEKRELQVHFFESKAALKTFSRWKVEMWNEIDYRLLTVQIKFTSKRARDNVKINNLTNTLKLNFSFNWIWLSSN